MSEQLAVPSQPYLPMNRRAEQAAVRLVCLPYLGGGMASYPELAGLWGRRIAPLTARLPGRDTRRAEPAADQVSALVSALAAECLRLPQPYAIFGHSWGAMLAHELCLAMQAAGQPPGVLIVSGSPPGWAVDPAVFAISPDRMPAAVASMLDLGQVPAAVLTDLALRSAVEQAIEQDLLLRASYRPSRQLVCCDLLAITGRHDRSANPAAIQAWRDSAIEPARVSVRVTDGDHFWFRGRREVLCDQLGGALVPLIEGTVPACEC